MLVAGRSVELMLFSNSAYLIHVFSGMDRCPVRQIALPNDLLQATPLPQATPSTPQLPPLQALLPLRILCRAMPIANFLQLIPR